MISPWLICGRLWFVMPPADAWGEPVGLADAFDVPVIVRWHSSPLTAERRPDKKRIDGAWRLWPTSGDIPPAGDYLVPTTWRGLLDAAMTVGRDPFVWLAAVPGLAWAEIIARRSPLAAYLYRTSNLDGPPGTSGYRLGPNVVYRDGTEKTARALFAYRLGMTMAEWACRGLMGLDPTVHAEAVPSLLGRGSAWSQKNGQPDLVGFHRKSALTWLIEAKAARRLGKTELAKGVRQLSLPGLMSWPHVRLMCGTSIEHRVFVTIDVEAVDRSTGYDVGPDDQEQPSSEGDADLLELARSRMLTYFALQGLPPESLLVRPVGQAIAVAQQNQGRAADLMTPLETDESTRSERVVAQDPAVYYRRPPSVRSDMLTGRVPGTELILGMSRRLFAACRSLVAEESQLLPVAWTSASGLFEDAPLDSLDEEAADDRIREQRAQFAYWEDEARGRLLTTTREAYEIGRESSWQQLLGLLPQLATEPPANLLEGATPDTYLAIETFAPAVTSAS